MADSARVALVARIAVVAAAARVAGFAAAHIVADIAAPAAGLAGIAAAIRIAAARIVEALAGDNMARRARSAARGIAPVVRIVVVVDNFARDIAPAASARPVGRAAALGIAAGLGIAGIAGIAALVADSFGMFAARNFAQASLWALDYRLWQKAARQKVAKKEAVLPPPHKM